MTSLPKFSVDNPVLVGVLMTTILVGGVFSALTLVRELFPETRPDAVMIATPYPGATPAEVEKGISRKIEEEIKDIEHIEKVETSITEGLSSILVTMTNDAKDIDLVVNDFKAVVDAIPRDELPTEAEETMVAKFEPRLPVISVAIYGDVPEDKLKQAGRRLEDDLQLLPDISDVVLSGIRKGELSVEVQPEKLIEYGVSLRQIRDAIAQSNLDLPGGQLKTAEQNVAVRTLGETDQADLIADTIIRTTPDGQIVRVSDLGRVIDGFEDSDIRGRFNGKPAVDITVYKTSDQDAIEISAKVRAFIAGKQRQPMQWDWLTRVKGLCGVETEARQIYHKAWLDPFLDGLEYETHTNLARFIEQRLDLLTRNGIWGLILVFISLLIFLNWRVAFWVMMGLVISLCGAVLLMAMLGTSLSLISMFGLIVVLGLIVDDAIVVGENVYSRVERGEEPKLAAVRGAEEVSWPVVVAVLTTIAAFMPLRFIEGRFGDFMGVLPVVVGCALAVSLIESLSILPSHLADSLRSVRRDLAAEPPRHWFAKVAGPIRKAQLHFVHDVLGERYQRFLRKAIEFRYVTVTVGLAALIVTVGIVAGGRVPFVFIQKMDSETIIVNIEMPVGTPIDQTESVIRKIEQAAMAIPEEVKTVYALAGGQVSVKESTVSSRSHLGQLIVEIAEVDQRDRTSEEIIADLRKTSNKIPGVNSIRYVTMQGGPGGSEIELEITGQSFEQLQHAADCLKEELAGFGGVYDIADDFEEGRREAQVTLRDSARPLGITTQMLATEVRGAFYGLDARTIQRDREDVDIRVRFPQERRRHIYELESMRIAAPGGQLVPFSEVATLVDGRGYSAIRRVDYRRAVVIKADVDQSIANADEINNTLAATIIPELESSMLGLQIDFAGNRLETMKSFGSLKRDFLIALLIVYVMLTALFKSYIKPLIVLTAVPFGLVGAVVGHLLMGYPLTILSVIGIVALTGIVVNDALILVDFVNKEVAQGHPVHEAVVHAGRRRLRPILLTTLTTVLGLSPLMAEQSFQAKFLIPMAVSISFGLVFATMLTLIVIPCNYVIIEDLKAIGRRIWYGPQPVVAEST